MKLRRRGRRVVLEQLECRLNMSAFAEPVRLSSVGGVLDITLRAHESSQVIEVGDKTNPSAPGVPTLVDGFLTYAWTVHAGLSSDGRSGGDGPFGPTLQVNPGDTLRILLENDLRDVSPISNAAGDQPTNFHTHGLIISPAGNSDNVLLDIPAGYSNRYEFQIPVDQEPGVNWYHPHRHGYVLDQVYRGMVGFLIVGPADSNIDQVDGLPTRLMVIQAQSFVNDPTTGRLRLDHLNPTETGDLQLTVNGLYVPELQMAAETEVWVGLQIDPTDLVRTFIPDPAVPPADWDMDAPGNQPTFYIAQDGSAFPMTVEKARVALAPGKRVSEVVSAPPAGEERTFAAAAITPKAVQVPYYQPLMTIKGFGQGGNPDDWVGLPLTGPDMQYEDLSLQPVDVRRTVVFETVVVDGVTRFLINGQVWPDTPVFQPRAGEVEEWTVINKDPFPHPIHLHMQHFQAQAVNVGEPGYTVPPHYYDQDVWYMDPETTSVFRIKFRPTLGQSVFHCHNLFHEDGGMMAHLNVIAARPLVASAPADRGVWASFYPLGADGASVSATPVATVAPFGPGWTRGMSVAMGDVNRDGVPDAVFAAGDGRIGRVVVLDGATDFTTTILDLDAFGAGFRGRLNVAAGDVNGDRAADVIVATAGGSAPLVRVFSGRTGALLSEFLAYDAGFLGGVRLAAGDVDGSGRTRIVTAPGPGLAPEVRVFGWDLYTPNGEPPSHGLLGEPARVAAFLAGSPRDRRGVAVAAAMYDGELGGFLRIVTSTAATGEVSVWNLDAPGHAMTHGGATAAQNQMDHGHNGPMPSTAPAVPATSSAATRLTRFRPFGRWRPAGGLALGSVNTTTGALLTAGPRNHPGPAFRLFNAGRDARPVYAGTVRNRSGRGLSLGGS